MITDPAHPDYRYPAVGERLWHGPWTCWVVVRDPVDCPLPPKSDQVPVTFEDTRGPGVVYLRSLRTVRGDGCEDCASHAPELCAFHELVGLFGPSLGSAR